MQFKIKQIVTPAIESKREIDNFLNGVRGVVVAVRGDSTRSYCVDFGVAYEGMEYQYGRLHNNSVSHLVATKTCWWFSEDELRFVLIADLAEWDEEQHVKAVLAQAQPNDFVMVKAVAIQFSSGDTTKDMIARVVMVDDDNTILVDFGRGAPVYGHSGRGNCPSERGWFVHPRDVSLLYPVK